MIVVSSDRGLCGGLNTNLTKKTKLLVKDLESQNKNVTIVCIGKKGYDALSLYYENNFNYNFKFINITDIDYTSLQRLGNDIIKNFSKGNFNECYVLYNFFKSVISQEVKIERILPYKKSNYEIKENENDIYFEFEPDIEQVLSKILPKNFVVQVYKTILESRASEQGARMTAMDNATRNAGEMIDNLSLKYNRQRQAMITKELIEIISGAEAL